MSLSKKKRFEVFKRDGFRCAYCGNTPPTVILECDHIVPKSKGGQDDMLNLITACFDCNRGKSDNSLDNLPSPLLENQEEQNERETQISEYRKLMTKIAKRLNKDSKKIETIFTEAFPDYHLKPTFGNASLKPFLELLPFEIVERAMWSAVEKDFEPKDRVIKYFCGTCWNIIKERKSKRGSTERIL